MIILLYKLTPSQPPAPSPQPITTISSHSKKFTFLVKGVSHCFHYFFGPFLFSFWIECKHASWISGNYSEAMRIKKQYTKHRGGKRKNSVLCGYHWATEPRPRAAHIQAPNYMRKNYITICWSHLKLDICRSLYALSNNNTNNNNKTLIRINLCI